MWNKPEMTGGGTRRMGKLGKGRNSSAPPRRGSERSGGYNGLSVTNQNGAATAREGMALIRWRISFGTRMAGALVAASLVACPSAGADRLILKSGYVVEGDVEIHPHRIAVRSGARLVTFSSQQLLRPEPGDPTDPPERFTLEQDIADKGQRVDVVPRFIRVTPFDDHGRRSVVARGPKDKEITAIQAITELYPTHAVIRGTNFIWETTLALDRIPSEQLLAILDRAVAKGSGPDEPRIIHFLIQAGRWEDASRRLAANSGNLELKPRLEELSKLLNLRAGRAALDQCARAVAAGQEERADQLLEALQQGPPPEELAPALEDARTRRETARANVARARDLVESARSQAGATSDAEMLDRAVGEIAEALSPATTGRLGPLLDLAQGSLSASERLALALSGWTCGPELATKDLALATRLWHWRERVLEARDGESEVELQGLTRSLGEAGAAKFILEMLPLLSAPPPEFKPDFETQRTFALPGEGTGSYRVRLPPHYDRHRRYPALVTLHAESNTAADQLALWAPLAAEHGYIVLAPEYANGPGRPYEYSLREHAVILGSLRDARKRLAIDCDRVFLTGHEAGAFATWDIGMSHPDQFAGLVPIGGAPTQYCKLYWPNLAYLSVYNIEGSRNGVNPSLTRAQFERYFLQGFDAIAVAYPGRGGGTFVEELPSVFQWMKGHSRRLNPRELEMVTARYSDRRFYWLEADSFLPHATIAPELLGRQKVRPARLVGTINDQGLVQITPSGLAGLNVIIHPRLVPLDDPRIEVRVHRKVIHQGPIAPDLETILREFRRTGDATNPVVRVLRAADL